ncbi:MAG: hypothetical protein OXG15_03385 [Gammaproteobacteria bacterium]|nr:hypothetical protein [Gammaproteobacteria bacterium]
MLESVEGQLNAVFACYGSAAQHGQLMENALAKLVTKLKRMTISEALPRDIDKKTTGQLLNLFRTKFVEEIDEWVPDFLDSARKKRNFLVHEYFLKRNDSMGVEAGRIAMLRELLDIESDLLKAAGLVNGLSVAIEETIQGKRDERGHGETVFSVKLKIDGCEQRN